MFGLDADRVAEVLVHSEAGRGRRGSGYRLSDTTVLTAAHVVNHAASVRVRFNADSPNEWVADVTQMWADRWADVAALTIGRTAGADGRRAGSVPPGEGP